MKALACIIGLIFSALAAQCSISAKHLVIQVRKHFEKIEDYTCEMTFSASGPDIYIGKTTVKIFYKKPGKIHFEAKEGFALLPKNLVSVGDPFADVADRLGQASVSRVKLDGKPHYLLTVPPSADQASLGGKYWIDPNSYLVVKAEQATVSGGSLSSRISYNKIGGQYWMPVKLSIKGKPGNVNPPFRMRNDPDMRVKPPMQPFTAEIIIKDYKINSGIHEKIFINDNKGESDRNPTGGQKK